MSDQQIGNNPDAPRTVGIVGLGQMGSPMANHLLDAGFAVVGHDVDERRVKALVEAGGTEGVSARAVAEQTPVVITSLPSAQALDAVLTADDGLLAAGRHDLLVVETSTLDLDTKERARQAAEAAGATLLDCPLSGTAAQAIRKDLVVYASGNDDAVNRCVPLFEGFARAHYHLGEFGSGSKMKFIANHLVSIHNVAAAEAFVLGTKAGIDPQTLFDVIASGAGSSRMFEVRGPMMVARDYDQPGMSGRVFQKDLSIIGGFARSMQCPVPLFAASSQIYAAALALGFGESEAAAVHAALEHMAGLDGGQSG